MKLLDSTLIVNKDEIQQQKSISTLNQHIKQPIINNLNLDYTNEATDINKNVPLENIKSSINKFVSALESDGAIENIYDR